MPDATMAQPASFVQKRADSTQAKDLIKYFRRAPKVAICGISFGNAESSPAML
jgi:hypothetical protein